MGLILVHEYGHLWAMKRTKTPNKGLYFIPFLGCLAIMKKMPSSRAAEAQISIMGPAWGTALTLVLAVLYPITSQPIFGVMAFMSSIINLLNLSPLSLLDGGRVFKAITFSINKCFGMTVMVLGLIGACLLVGNFLNNWIGWIILIYLIVVGTGALRHEYQNRHIDFQTRMTVKQMFGYGFAYLGLLVVLFGAMLIQAGNEAVMQALMNLVQ